MKNWTKNKGETTLKHVEKIGIMPRISKNLHLLGEAAIDEVLKNGELDEADWQEIFQQLVLQIVEVKELFFLPMRGRLAVAIMIVASKTLSFFPVAFRLLCDWGFVGGCFWIVEEELLRHSAIYIIRDGVAGVEQTDYNPSDAKVSLTELLPREIPTFVTHPIVRKKMALLRGEFFWLLDKMGKSGNPLEELANYYSEYPLKEFVPWFMEWAMNLLQRSEIIFKPFHRDPLSLVCCYRACQLKHFTASQLATPCSDTASNVLAECQEVDQEAGDDNGHATAKNDFDADVQTDQRKTCKDTNRLINFFMPRKRKRSFKEVHQGQRDKEEKEGGFEVADVKSEMGEKVEDCLPSANDSAFPREKLPLFGEGMKDFRKEVIDTSNALANSSLNQAHRVLALCRPNDHAVLSGAIQCTGTKEVDNSCTDDIVSELSDDELSDNESSTLLDEADNNIAKSNLENLADQDLGSGIVAQENIDDGRLNTQKFSRNSASFDSPVPHALVTVDTENAEKKIDNKNAACADTITRESSTMLTALKKSLWDVLSPNLQGDISTS